MLNQLHRVEIECRVYDWARFKSTSGYSGEKVAVTVHVGNAKDTPDAVDVALASIGEKITIPSLFRDSNPREVDVRSKKLYSVTHEEKLKVGANLIMAPSD